MSEKIRIPVTRPKTQAIAYQLMGIVTVLEALNEQKGVTAPGFMLAKMIVERELADKRADFGVMTLREAAYAGLPVQRVARIGSVFKGDKHELEVELTDPSDEEP